MRGIVSLAAALALSLTTSAEAPFPFRSEIILITFMLILATLVLHPLAHPTDPCLDLEQDRTLEQKEAHAREPGEGRGSPIEDARCLAMARRYMLK